jgi:hypothetical protein
VGRENIFKATIGTESLHQDSNDNGVRIVNFATSKNVARTGEGRGVYRVLVGNLWKRDHWGDPGVDGRIILR